jgi:hypothetical protein
MRDLLFTLCIAAAVAGCKDKKDGETGGGGGGGGAPVGGESSAPAAKLVEIDASTAGEAYAGWKVQAPEGSTAKDDFGALSVSDGRGFQLEIHEGPVDMAARKKEIEANDINTFKRYVTDKPDMVVYESDLGVGPNRKQFHFIATVKVGDKDYYCENAKGATSYTQPQVETMAKSCQGIKK